MQRGIRQHRDAVRRGAAQRDAAQKGAGPQRGATQRDADASRDDFFRKRTTKETNWTPAFSATSSTRTAASA
jgi:hypothetical protein